jgi:hypothetical protein
MGERTGNSVCHGWTTECLDGEEHHLGERVLPDTPPEWDVSFVNLSVDVHLILFVGGRIERLVCLDAKSIIVPTSMGVGRSCVELRHCKSRTGPVRLYQE